MFDLSKIIQSWGIIATGVVFISGAFIVIAFLTRVVSKIASRTFFQEKRKSNNFEKENQKR